MSDCSRTFVRSPALARVVAENHAELGRYFRMLARASLAGGALAVSACSSFQAELYERPLCTPTGGLVLFDASAPGAAHDFLGAFESGPDSGPRLISSAGEQCSGATDRAACDAEVASVERSFTPFVISTAGDAVASHVGPEGIDALLGPTVESQEEAVMRAWARGISISCTDAERGGVREVDDGWEVVGTRYTRICDPIIVERLVFFVGRDGRVIELAREEIERSGACVGRRPQGLVRSSPARGGDPVGLFFARVAHLEAAAVPAFEIMARELDALGAPRALGRAARAAAHDERRHAAMMGAIARRRGVVPELLRVEARPLRDRFALASDNAAEGCVRETFGALTGTYQAMTAKADDVAEAMTSIAADETRHAALSHAIAAWAEEGLDEAQRGELRRVRRRATDVLRAEASVAPPDDVAREAGLPSAAIAVAWVDRLARDLVS